MSPKAHKHLHYNVALVDKVWNLKRLCEAHLKIHIPLNMVLKDEAYRADLLEKAVATENDELVSLVSEIRTMEAAILQSSSEDESKRSRNKAKSFRINFFNRSGSCTYCFYEWLLIALIFTYGCR